MLWVVVTVTMDMCLMGESCCQKPNWQEAMQ